MYCAVFVYGGVIDYVKNVVTKFDPSSDTVQIWDNKGNILYDYEEMNGDDKV